MSGLKEDHSDYYFLSSKVRLRFKKQDSNPNPRKKYNLTTIQNSEKLQEFKLTQKNRFELLTLQEEDGVEDIRQSIKKVYNDTSQE